MNSFDNLLKIVSGSRGGNVRIVGVGVTKRAGIVGDPSGILGGDGMW